MDTADHPSVKGHTIMFIAGEASGDAHAAAVIRAIRARAPDVRIFGAGGPEMHTAGMELLLDLTEHAVVGLTEVFKNLWKLQKIFRDLVAEAERRRPDVVVLVDYPGFNLRFARRMKQRGIKVIYYISPQLWAWHASRAKQIERDVELMLTIFPFEKAWYAERAPRLRVEFVGHPFVDRIMALGEPAKRESNLVLLLPGSRTKEVEKIWPLMAQVVDRLPAEIQFRAAAVDAKTARMIQHPRVQVQTGGAHALMQRAALAITASGTATMESAFFGCPMVVVYKVTWLTYFIGRMVVRVNWLAMPNVIANREVIPEYIQHDAQPGVVARTASQLLTDATRRQTMTDELKKVVASLGGPGASDRAAQLILAAIQA